MYFNFKPNFIEKLLWVVVFKIFGHVILFAKENSFFCVWNEALFDLSFCWNMLF